MTQSWEAIAVYDPQRNCGALGFVLLSLASAVESWAADAPNEVKPDSPPPPVKLTSLEDHRRLLGLLGIQELREGVDWRDPLAPNPANYEESKATPYPALPDPLLLDNGQKVTSAEAWWKERRPEIVEHFDREVYGRVPGEVPQVKWELLSTEREPGLVFVKRLSGRVDNSSYLPIAVEIQLTLETPLEATHPVPVILELALEERQLSAGGRGRPAWEVDVVRRGWGYGTLALKSIQPHNGSGLTKGIIGLANKGQPRKVDDWGTLRAWAWGACRALDYLETYGPTTS